MATFNTVVGYITLISTITSLLSLFVYIMDRECKIKNLKYFISVSFLLAIIGFSILVLN